MLDRKDVKEGGEYLLDGKPVTVFMIHKPGSGESVTLCDALPAGCENPYQYLRQGTMQMRKFQRAALTPNVELSGPTAALSPEGPAQTQG